MSMSLVGSAPAAPGIEIPDSEPLGVTGLVESPGTPSAPNAWARFEFEIGCGNEGSKVLVVEWDPKADDGSGGGNKPAPLRQPVAAAPAASSSLDDWEVSWEGKVPREKNEVREVEGESTYRFLILLEDESQVPSVVTIAQRSTGAKLLARPMPAIYTPALGADVAKAAGRRGVLHTQWAEKRLEQLQSEYDREVKINREGVGAVMAYTDLTWIVDHFGLKHPYPVERQTPQYDNAPPMPQSPRSPVPGKLGEKLRGLKLATSASELANNRGPRYNQHYFTPGSSGTTATARSALSTSTTMTSGTTGSGVASLDAMVQSAAAANCPPVRPSLEGQATEDELFALPMSPRSPEMTKSPFSLIK